MLGTTRSPIAAQDASGVRGSVSGITTRGNPRHTSFGALFAEHLDLVLLGLPSAIAYVSDRGVTIETVAAPDAAGCAVHARFLPDVSAAQAYLLFTAFPNGEM